MTITLAAAQNLVRRAGTLQQELDEMGAGRPQKARRGTSNGNAAGSSEDRRRRRAWLLETYRADVDVFDGVPRWDRPVQDRHGALMVPLGEGLPACRCYRCGKLLTLETLTVDRIIPGCLGGTYRRNNIRPACGDCNEKTGGAVRRKTKHKCVDCQREDPNGERRFPRKLQQWGAIEACATHIKQRMRARGRRT